MAPLERVNSIWLGDGGWARDVLPWLPGEEGGDPGGGGDGKRGRLARG